MSCSRTQHSASNESGTSDPLISSPTHYHWATVLLIIYHELALILEEKLQQTFSSLAPPCWVTCTIVCSCLTRWLKSVIHWITVIPAGTVYRLHVWGIIPKITMFQRCNFLFFTFNVRLKFCSRWPFKFDPCFNSLPTGKVCMLICPLNILEKFFQEYHQRVKQFGRRTGPMLYQAWFGSKL